MNNIIKHRELLFAWSTRIIRARYQQSVLGGLWAIVQPLALVIVFSVIFTRFIQIDTGDIPYPVFSYTAMVPWVFFVSAITDMVESLVINMNLVTKIYFPREILPISALLARLVDFMIAQIILFLMIIYYQIPSFSINLAFIPLILLTQSLLALGLGFIGSSLNVFLRDIRHLFTLGLQLWFYATPIIYPITVVPEPYQHFFYLNPMTGIIQAYRAVLIYGQPPSSTLWLSMLISLLVFIGGYWFFKRVEYRFADVI